jgi:hypothetical protein
MIATVPVAWLVARAAGLVAFAFLTISGALGLALSTRLLGGPRGKMLLGWHQTLMWTAFGMVVLHGAALLFDPTIHFGLAAVLVPGSAPWRPIPVAAGIVTGWLMLVVALSFHVRRRMGQRRWRLMHYATFGAFGIGLYHALNVGSDLTGDRGLIFAGLCTAPLVWLTYARILMPRGQARKKPPTVAPVPPLLTTAVEKPRRPGRVGAPT